MAGDGADDDLRAWSNSNNKVVFAVIATDDPSVTLADKPSLTLTRQ
jgi:hypothetical protein